MKKGRIWVNEKVGSGHRRISFDSMDEYLKYERDNSCLYQLFRLCIYWPFKLVFLIIWLPIKYTFLGITFLFKKAWSIAKVPLRILAILGVILFIVVIAAALVQGYDVVVTYQ